MVKKKCPKCGKSEIVNDGDIEVWKIVGQAVKLAAVMEEVVGLKSDSPKVKMTISTERKKEV